MPHISVKLYPGRTNETKKNLAEKLTDFLSTEMEMDRKYFSVSIEEVDKKDWKTSVVDKINEDELYVRADF